MMSEYEKQAEDFLKKTGSSIKIEFKKSGIYSSFDDDENRDIYNITLKKGERKYSFTFGNSIAESGAFLRCRTTKKETPHKGFNISDELRVNRELPKGRIRLIREFENLYFRLSNEEIFFKEPTAYGVLAGLTTYGPEDFEDFCSSYGYDSDSRKAEKVYKAVVREFDNLKMLYSDEELEALSQIQ